MKYTVEEIEQKVLQCETDRAGYNTAAALWEKMWTLQLYDKSPQTVLRREGREQVTLPTPYNVVHLARRLIASEPRIEVPAEDAENDSDESADKRERWLTAFWQRANVEQSRDIIADAAWQVLVRGRCVFEVKWVEDVLPERMKGKRLPILVRTLDPMNVGIKQGPLYVEYAFHKYRQDRKLVAQRYPNIKKSSTWRENEGKRYAVTEVDVIDFWYTDGDGNIWNAVVVDGIFAKPPKQTTYPMIPIIEGLGDAAPIADEEFRSLSILHPIRDLWPYSCRLASQIGTGLLFYFWPAILVSNETGQAVPDLDIRPGVTTPVPMGTKVEMIRGDVNVPLAQNMLMQVEAQIQQSTFPDVMYGKAPGAMSAGYGVSILADQARGRVAQFRGNMEMTLIHVHELILALVEDNAPAKGIRIIGRGAGDGKIYHETITAKDISGQWTSLVNLAPQITTDDAQKQTLGMRMVEKRIISKRTYRDKFMNMPFPADEQKRIELEAALESPQMQPKVLLRAVQAAFPDSWAEIIKGTPFEGVALQDEGIQPPGMPGQGPPGMPMPGAPPMPPGGPPQGAMPPPGMMPPEMQQGPPQPQGPPPGMEQAQPPMPQAGAEAGINPDMLIQMLLSGNLPPGVTVEMVLQLLQQMGMPQELFQQLLAQLQQQQGPMGVQGLQGVPASMTSGVTPESMGLGAAQPGTMPGVYNDMTGQPLGETEEMDRLAQLQALRRR